MDVHVRINGDLGDRLLGASDEVEGNIEGFSHGRFPEADERRAGPAPTASKRVVPSPRQRRRAGKAANGACGSG